MNRVIDYYNLLVEKFEKIEKISTENETHDKRVILKRIFPVILAYGIGLKKIKNGKKAFKLYGKLRDIQVQIIIIKSKDNTREFSDYFSFLKKSESKLRENTTKFSNKHKVRFPKIAENAEIDKVKIHRKIKKSQDKLTKIVQSGLAENGKAIHKVRLVFKNFRYWVETISLVEFVDETLLEKIKNYQDKLGEIQDYEVLIEGINKFYKNRDDKEKSKVIQFETYQKELINNFMNEIPTIILACSQPVSKENNTGISQYAGD